MVTWRNVKIIFEEILNEINNPNIVLLNMDEWTWILKDKFDDKTAGMSHTDRYIITVEYINEDIIEIKDSIWHEILHILYPNAKHWWIECCAQRLSGSNKKGKFVKKYKHSLKDIPDRIKIIKKLQKRKFRLKKINYKERWAKLKNKPPIKKWKFKFHENKRKYCTFL